MIDAWKRVKANKGAAGIDNMPVDDFMAFARKHWGKIRSALCAGTYQPLPVKRVEIPKPTGGTRPLGILTVIDRLIQHAISQVLRRSSIWAFRKPVSVSVRDIRPTTLVKLGTNLRVAISLGLSRKGPWRLSRTLATQTGMSNEWLKDQGLESVKELWVNIHYPATAR